MAAETRQGRLQQDQKDTAVAERWVGVVRAAAFTKISATSLSFTFMDPRLRGDDGGKDMQFIFE